MNEPQTQPEHPPAAAEPKPRRPPRRPPEIEVRRPPRWRTLTDPPPA